MNALIIETSTERGVAAIVNDEGPLFIEELPQGYQNSKFLLTAIEKGFQTLESGPKVVDFVVVGAGPGSYTGIRVGVITGKAFAFGRRVPLVSVPSISGFIPNDDGRFLALIDARSGGFYVQKGVLQEGKVMYTTEPEIVKMELIGSYFVDVDVVVTPHEEKIRARLREIPCLVEEKAPSSEQMYTLASEKLKKGEVCKGYEVDILYLKDWGT